MRQKILFELDDYPSEISYTDLLPICDDSTGKLNYHLRVLENLVEKKENGYDLSVEGKQVVKWMQQLEETNSNIKSRPNVVFDKIYPDNQLYYKFTIQTLTISLFIVIPTIILTFTNTIFAYILLFEIIILMMIVWILKKYVHSIWYRITETEIEVHKGVLTYTHKIVPYRTITNVEHKIGPFDRIFNLSTVDVHTAGNSASSGPEEHIVGMVEGEEIKDTLLEKIRMLNPIDYITASRDGGQIPVKPALIDIANTLKELNKDLEENV